MPFYRFRIHGAGVFPNGVAGFYTTRRSWAWTREAAELKVLKQVQRGLRGLLNGAAANLEIDEVCRIGALEFVRESSNRGHTFYLESD